MIGFKKINPVRGGIPGTHPIFRFTNIILPPVSELSWQGEIQSDWHDITYLDDPCCAHCGVPFEYDQGADAICAPCTANPPVYDRARAALQYNEHSAPLILAFKHGGRTQNLNRFARQLLRAGHPFWPRADYIVPVPLHRERLLKRKYNQAALLTKHLSRWTEANYEPDILFRHKATPSQGSQTSKGRFRNVQGAFSVPDKIKEKLEGKTVVLIDDVMTTGATLESCVRTLKRSGANTVYCLVLARVVRDAQIPT